jgi:hypothetical protein
MKNVIRMGLIAGALVTSVAAQAQTAWTDKVTLGGDLRVRQNREFNEQTPGPSNTQNYTQIRARLTASAKVNDAMTANFRLATHNNNLSNVSSNDTLGDGGTASEKSTFDLDLAYGDWRVMQGLVASVGKAPNPFWQAGKNEMMWDADLAFDGVTAKWAADMDKLKPFVNASYNWIALNEADASAAGVTNTMLLGVQAGASMGLGDKMKGTLAAAYHSFNNGTQNLGGNFWLANVGAEVSTEMVMNMPLAVYVDWVQNQGSRDENEKTGWIAGVTAGQLSNVGSWQAWYNFREVGADAVLNGAADSEFADGQNVDVTGHQIGGGYMAWENTTVGLNYLQARRAPTGTDGVDYERWMADVVWKF